jgi:hypothetical protein
MQVCSRESSAGNARRRFMQVEKWKSQLALNFNLSNIVHFQETSARASPASDSREQTCIV